MVLLSSSETHGQTDNGGNRQKTQNNSVLSPRGQRIKRQTVYTSRVTVATMNDSVSSPGCHVEFKRTLNGGASLLLRLSKSRKRMPLRHLHYAALCYFLYMGLSLAVIRIRGLRRISSSTLHFTPLFTFLTNIHVLFFSSFIYHFRFLLRTPFLPR